MPSLSPNHELRRLGTFPVEELIPTLQSLLERAENGEAVSDTIELLGQEVRWDNLRMRTFLVHGLECADENCSLKGDFFAVERHAHSRTYHLSLYGLSEQGVEALFTHDHTLARALGGADAIHNTQPMCWRCNFLKSKQENKVLYQKRLAQGLHPYHKNKPIDDVTEYTQAGTPEQIASWKAELKHIARWMGFEVEDYLAQALAQAPHEEPCSPPFFSKRERRAAGLGMHLAGLKWHEKNSREHTLYALRKSTSKSVAQPKPKASPLNKRHPHEKTVTPQMLEGWLREMKQVAGWMGLSVEAYQARALAQAEGKAPCEPPFATWAQCRAGELGLHEEGLKWHQEQSRAYALAQRKKRVMNSASLETPENRADTRASKALAQLNAFAQQEGLTMEQARERLEQEAAQNNNLTAIHIDKLKRPGQKTRENAMRFGLTPRAMQHFVQIYYKNKKEQPAATLGQPCSPTPPSEDKASSPRRYGFLRRRMR